MGARLRPTMVDNATSFSLGPSRTRSVGSSLRRWSCAVLQLRIRKAKSSLDCAGI